jgi:hypothetical protein
MTYLLIVVFGAAFFCLVVMILMPARMGAISSSQDGQTGAQPRGTPDDAPVTGATATAKDGVGGSSLLPVPYRPLDLHLPRLPEPHLHHHFTVVSALPFPAVSPIRSLEPGPKKDGCRFAGARD